MKHRKLTDKGRSKAGRRRFSAWIHTAGAKCALIVAVSTIILLVAFCLACAPKRYDLSVHAISRYTITATKDVVDEITTEERRKAAAAAVEPTYHLQEGVSDDVIANLNAIFDELRTVQQYGLTLREPDATPEEIKERPFEDAEIEYAQKLVTLINLTRYQATTLLRTETADFETMVTTVNTAVTNALNTTIREGQVSQAISTITQIVGYRVDLSLTQNVLPAVLRYSVKANMVIEQEATEQARQTARSQVEDVVYLQGQNIIRAGESVNLNQLEMLRSLGLLENNEYDVSVYAGGGMIVLASIAALLLLMKLLRPEVLHDIRKTAVVMSVLLISMALCMAMMKIIHVYLAPIALAALLLTGLLGWQTAIPATMSISIMVSGLAAAGSSATSWAEMVHLMLMGIISGSLVVWFLNGRSQRMRVVGGGVLAAIVNACVLLATSLMTSSSLSAAMWANILWAMGGGLVSGLAAVGLQPVFEAVFNLATPSKLLELGNQNHPLLRRLMLEAPGTYHHSMIVANLAEAAAEKIGANPLLARTGAYFHDVGKLKRPHYFKENQMGGDNPLDMNDPYVSAAIVTSHTRDGLQMAQKHRLPPEIQQIIVEHHGDTPVMFFYHKALQQADGKTVDISDFRYDGTRPASKEAAIVMLADTIEAAVRSMPDPTPKAIEEFIERLVRGKLEDGQLSNSPLTLRDIDGICEAFATVLNGVFHERIEYPKTELPKRNSFFVNKEEAEKGQGIEQPAADQVTEEAGAMQLMSEERKEEEKNDPDVGD